MNKSSKAITGRFVRERVAESARELSIRGFAHFTLPDYGDSPAELPEQLPIVRIALPIAPDFLHPIATILSWEPPLQTSMMMPKAPVNEKDGFPAGKNNVRLSG